MLGLSNEDGATPANGEPSVGDLMQRAATISGDGETVEQWRHLLTAIASLADSRPLDAKLNRIVEMSTDLTGARWGSITLFDREEDPPRRLLFTHGISPGEAVDLGVLPGGHWFESPERDAEDRDDDSTRHDPAAGRSPTRTSLQVPVRAGGTLLGALHLAEKATAPEFSAEDERLAEAMAAAAGLAVDNASLHLESARREHSVSAATELLRPKRVDSEHDTERDTTEHESTAMQIVADWARDVAGADVAWVVAGPEPASLHLRAVSGMDVEPDAMAAVDLSTSLARCVAFAGRPLKVKSVATHSRAVDVPTALGAPTPTGPGLVVPLRGAIGVDAVVTLGWWGDADANDRYRDPTLPTLIAEHAPLVLHLTRARETEERLVVLEERERIARDLHDLIIQQLFAIGLDLQAISWLRDPDEMARRLDGTTDEIEVAIRDIRRTIFSLGSIHGDADPRAAIIEVVDRAARTLKLRPTLRFEGPVGLLIDSDVLPEVLAVLTEALSNAARHAQATACDVGVTVADELTVEVSDDGTGLPDEVDESGLANLRHRAEQHGGRFDIASAPDRGATLTWSIPIRLPGSPTST